MSGTVFGMHDDHGNRYAFEYVEINGFKPNQSGMCGYGTDEWMFLCRLGEDKYYIVSFAADAGQGYIWTGVRIPRSAFDEMVISRGDGLYKTFYLYFKNEENRIYSLHPDDIALAKQLVGSERSRMGKITDQDFYGQ